jgi:hypothetical protein
MHSDTHSLPRVSIVIPVYNGANYMREAIDSALAQTYPNVEVIVVNDGSTDNGATDTMARSYGDRIRYFTKPNGGVSSALNVGIRNMTGDWFAWLSHDDAFSTDRITEDMALLREQSGTKVTFCSYNVINSASLVTQNVTNLPSCVSNPREAIELGGVDMCTMTIHRSCFDRIGLFNEANRTTQDVEMSLHLAKYFPFYRSAGITHKRQHSDQGTVTLKALHKNDLLRLCEFIHRDISLQDFFPNLTHNPRDLTNAWFWLGNLYRGFGANAYAREAYANGINCNPKITSRILQRINWFIRLQVTPLAFFLVRPLHRKVQAYFRMM